MKNLLKVLLATSIVISSITGYASPQVPLQSLDQSAEEGLSQQEVKEAIHKGAKTATWTTEDKGPGKILAVYSVTEHTIAVNITYTEKSYSINYAYSINVHVHCTEEDKAKGVATIMTKWPEKVCGGSRPALIYEGYNSLLKGLNSEIRAALDEASLLTDPSEGVMFNL
jgi:hypothetical protein